MFPTIFALAVSKLGTLTGKGSGLINMAIVGGAAIPPIQGYLADRIGLHVSFIVPALCYIYILYYGFVGSKIKPAAVVA
jgi:FHS family L-fucose permease-like MFS transporter